MEDPNFFRNFNQSYYQVALANPSVAYDTETLKNIAASVRRKVEGQRFDVWYAHQQIFNFNPPVGDQVIWKGDTSTLYALNRDSNGFESMYWGVPVAWQVESCEGEVLLSGTDFTTMYGWVEIPLWQIPYQGKVRIVAHISLSGQEVDWSIETVNGFSQGVFGIISQGCQGEVWAKEKGVGEINVAVTHGAFEIPDFANAAGTFTAGMGGGKTAMTITKDASSYFVIVQ